MASERALAGWRRPLVAAGLLLGLLAEWLSFGAMDAWLRIADFAIGALLLGGGLVAWERRPGTRIGELLALSGLGWFIGGLAPTAVYVHRGPLVHALLSYPTGRLSGRFRIAVVLLAYLDGASRLIGASPPVTIALALVLPITAITGAIAAAGPVRRARTVAAVGSVALAVLLLLSIVDTLAGWHAERPLLVAYDLVVGGAAVGLVAALLNRGWSSGAVTDLVVDLGESGETGTLRDRLAEALGDRSLVIGYWLGEKSGYVDDIGRPVIVPPATSGLAITPIVQGDQPIAVLVHDGAVLGDPALVDSVAGAASIALSNVRLQGEIASRVTELEASRRRLVEAADAERRRLEEELAAGASRRLERVSLVLGQAQAIAVGPVAEAFSAAQRELDGAELELRDLARGIRPMTLAAAGLAAAVRELAERSPVPVVLDLPDGRFEPVVEATLYFVCAEGLTNIAKYADASRASITVKVDAHRLRLDIADDGVGGADPSRGSGLRGLGDRVDALGGHLAIASQPGGGTRLHAELPVE